MTKFTIFNVTIKIDVRTFINKISFTIYASFVLVTTIIFFKNRSVLKTNQFTAPSTQVSFVQISPPFAMMSRNLTFRSVQPVVEHFQENASIAETGGEVLVKHSNDIVHYVAANAHLNNVNKRSNALPISQKDRVVQVAKRGATHFELYVNNDIQSFENQRWRGFTFDYTYDFQSDQKIQPMKASDTHSYAFTSRYKIQRGDGTVNPFVPTKQLGRNTTLDLQAEQIEHVISNLTSNVSVSSEKNFTVLQGAQSGRQGGTSSESDGSGLSEAVTGSEGVHSSGPSEEGVHLTKPSSPSSEGSLVDVVQTGSEIELEPQEEAALEKKIVCGLGDMIVNAHNTSLLQQIQKSPKFETAAKLVHQDIGEELNQRLNAAPFTPENAERVFKKFPGLFQDPENNQVSVYLEEPSVLTKLSRYVTLLEIGDKISVPEYPVNFTGDKKDSNAAEFSTFGSTVVYNQKSGFREEIKKNVKKLSNQTVSFSNAIALEDLLTKVPEENRLAIFTRVVTNISNEPQFKDDFLRLFLGHQETSIPCITYDFRRK